MRRVWLFTIALFLLTGCSSLKPRRPTGVEEPSPQIRVRRGGYRFDRPGLQWREERTRRLDRGFVLRDHAVQIWLDSGKQSFGRVDPVERLPEIVRRLGMEAEAEVRKVPIRLEGACLEAEVSGRVRISRRDRFRIDRRIRLALRCQDRRWVVAIYAAPPEVFGIGEQDFERLFRSISFNGKDSAGGSQRPSGAAY